MSDVGLMPRKGAKDSTTSTGVGRSRASPDRDWQDDLTSRLRRLIHAADPDAVEQQKWKKPSNPDGVPVWYHDGIICLVGALKNRVRITFPEGASLVDPKGLFNACLEAGHMRGVDIYEDDPIDAEGIKSLVRAAVHFNRAAARGRE
jgi:hypothetical protein